jgi:hypothetical protein
MNKNGLKSARNNTSSMLKQTAAVSSTLITVIIVATFSNTVNGQRGVLLTMSKYRTKVFYQPGDIVIGAIAIMSSNDDYTTCNSQLGWNISPVNTEAIPFAVNTVNADPSILPNVTLGFVVLDSCFSDITALAAAAHFLGNSVKVTEKNGACSTQHATSCSASNSRSGDAGIQLCHWVLLV